MFCVVFCKIFCLTSVILLFSRDDVSFLMITHDHDSGLMVVSKVGKKKLNVPDIGEHSVDPEEIRLELKLAKSKKLLLLFMWITDEELRLLKMHPESISWDVTHQTNKQKRDLFVGVAKDGNNHGFHVCHAFLPSQKRWVFSIIFRLCIPRLWGLDIVKRNRLSMTDGDTDEYVPFIAAAQKVRLLFFMIVIIAFKLVQGEA